MSAPGTGLGLAIVRAVARLHGGDARIEAGRGGRVVVSWPQPAPPGYPIVEEGA